MKVAETRNITRASESLNVAQTALGQQIRYLEDMLGVRLLERHSRGISLTEPGEVLYRHALSILGSIEDARRDVMAYRPAKRAIVDLGVTPSIQALIGSELLASVRDEVPDVSFRVVEELSFILIDALLRGELDIALAYEFESRPELSVIPLVEEELLFVAGAGSRLRGETVSFEEAVGTDLALVSDRDIIWRLVHEEAGRQGLSVNVAFEVQSMPAIKTLVARGGARHCLYRRQGGCDQSVAFAGHPACQARDPRQLRGAEQDRLAGGQGCVRSDAARCQPARSAGCSGRSRPGRSVSGFRRFRLHRRNDAFR